MYNVTIEYEDDTIYLKKLTRKQAREAVDSHLDACDIWVDAGDGISFSIYDFPMAIW